MLTPQTSLAAKAKSKKAKPKAAAPAKRVKSAPKPKAAPVAPAPAPISEPIAEEPSPEVPATPTTTAKAPKARRESVSSFFGSFSWLWWQEPLELIGPDGTRYAMVTTANGPCFGAGWKRVKASYEVNFQGCFFSAGNEVGAIVTDIGYYQQGVESYGVMAGPGILYRPSSGSVSFGIQIPGFFRYAQWTIPPQAGYDVDGPTRITGGALLQANWTSKRITLGQKVGMFYKTGAMWAVQLDFRFW